MKRPSYIAYLFGNPLSMIALLIAAGYFVYEWWRGQGSPAVALVAFVAAGYSVTTSERIQKYNQWQREWRAMAGEPPEGGFSRLLARIPFRLVLGLSAWAVWGYFVATMGGEPGMQIPVALFWLVTLVMAVGGIYQLFRRVRPRRRASQDVPVTLCVGMPSQSPTPAQASAMLPTYCRALVEFTTHH
jgi:hypothetical protein